MRKRRFYIYPLALLSFAVSFLLLVWAYIVKCPVDIPKYRTLGGSPVEIYQDGIMRIETGFNDFNARLAAYCDENSRLLPEGVSVSGIAVAFMGGTPTTRGSLYINVTHEKAKAPLSFKASQELSLKKDAAQITFSDIRLGRYELPYLGGFLWRLVGLPESVSVPSKSADGLMYLSAIGQSSGGITFTYEYDRALLAEKMTEILSLSDETKIEYHRVNGGVDGRLLDLAAKGSATEDEAMELIRLFDASPESFPSLCMLLKSEGIFMLCDTFSEAYYHYADAEKLVEASENELDSGLNEFNKEFSRLLLQYLYRNPDYTVENGALYLNGNEITPETILGSNDKYNVEIWADEKSITARYGFSGYVATRVILTN